MSDLTPEQEAQIPVLRGAWNLLEPTAAGNFAAGWPAVNPQLRRHWSREWLQANSDQIAADGYDPEQVLNEFMADRPDHPLWLHFVRVYQRSLLEVLSDIEPRDWTIGTERRVVAPDIEVLHLSDRNDAPGGVLPAGSRVGYYSILMRRFGMDWRVLNVNSEAIPD